MKFYAAGKWEDRWAVKKLQEALVKLGHTVTVDWTWHEKADEGYPVQYSIDDIKGVQLADAYVGLFVGQYRYKGALVEMGAALGLDKKVYLIGHAIDSCLFAKHPLVQQFETEDEFLSYVRQTKGGRNEHNL